MIKMKLNHIITLLLVIYMSGPAPMYGQEIQGGIDFQVGLPHGNFKNQMDRGGIGIGIMGGYRFKDTPVMLGLDFGFMNFGSDVREEPLSSTIPDLRVEVENSYNFIHGDLLLRFIVPNPDARIRPYVDGLFGFNHLFTETVIRERRSVGSENDLLRDTNFRDTAMNYGIGAGTQVLLFRPRIKDIADGVSVRAVYLNLIGRHINGGRAEYLKQGSIRREEGEVFFDVSQSRTTMSYIKLGLVVNF